MLSGCITAWCFAAVKTLNGQTVNCVSFQPRYPAVNINTAKGDASVICTAALFESFQGINHRICKMYIYSDNAFMMVVSIIFLSFVVPYYLHQIVAPFFKNKLFTVEQLRYFDGVASPHLYLSILGEIYDVTTGAEHYGPEGQYNMFAGRDNSKGFQTGGKHDEDENLSLMTGDLRTLAEWIKFYKTHYIYKGILIGKYFTSLGNPTPYRLQVEEELEKVMDIETEEENLKKMFPPCNMEWLPNKYTMVWCTKNSGGVSRDWVGVPRRFFDITMSAERCACISEDNMNVGVHDEYEYCEPESHSCNLYD